MFERSVSNILLIEDNPQDADLIRHALLKVENGINLKIARDGEEAVELFKLWEEGAPVPSIIVLDLKLPKLNGFDILTILKTHPRFRFIPVVILTASNNVEDIETAYRLGANSYIVKSINYDILTNTVGLLHRYWCGLNVRPE